MNHKICIEFIRRKPHHAFIALRAWPQWLRVLFMVLALTGILGLLFYVT